MLKKLRVKFIALNMATVAVVLAVVFTAICVIDYQQSVARVHETLDAALAHAGDAGGGPSRAPSPAPRCQRTPPVQTECPPRSAASAADRIPPFP